MPDYVKVIKEISTVQSAILSSQMKEILRNVNTDDAVQGMYKPLKLVYHPREPFFVIRQVIPSNQIIELVMKITTVWKKQKISTT